MGDRSLAVVMPALNEEDGIEIAVGEALRCGERLIAAGSLDRAEVVIVDDGSTDRTPELLAHLASVHPNLVVVRHQTNRGLGAAVRSGLRAASANFVFYTDSDLPVDLAVVDQALDVLDARPEVAAVSCYRTSRDDEGPRRFVYSLIYNGLVRTVLGLRVRDVNFAAKLLRAEALDGMDLRSEGSFIDAELLARLGRRGHEIAQFPAEYHARSKGVSTLSSMSVIRTIMEEFWTLAPQIRRERRAVPAR